MAEDEKPKDETPEGEKPEGEKPGEEEPEDELLKAAEEHWIVKNLKELFPQEIEGVTHCSGIPTLRIRKENLIEICSKMRDDPDFDFDYLSNLCGVDYPTREKRFDVVYHMYSLEKGHKLSLIVEVGEDEEIPSLCAVWPTADWQEREAWDLYGIRFSGHPNLKRILLPDWWETHPFRKDYPLEGTGEEQKVIEECLKPSKPEN